MDNEHEEAMDSDYQDEYEGDEVVMDEDDFHVVNDEEEFQSNARDENEDSIRICASHEEQSVYCVGAAHKSAQFCSGGGDDSVFLWNPTEEDDVRASKHDESVVVVGFSFDDEWVASGDMNGLIKVKRIKGGKEEFDLEGPSGEIEWLAWHPTGLVVLAGSVDSTVWMWNVAEEGMMMSLFSGHSDAVSCGGFTPNGRRVVTGSMDASLKLWDPHTGSCLHTFSGHGFHNGGIVSMAFTTTGDPIVATGGADGKVCLTRLDTKKVLHCFIHADLAAAAAAAESNANEEDHQVEGCSIECLSFCSSMPWLATGGTDGRVVIWDLTVQARRTVLVHPDMASITRCLFLPGSFKIATACVDGLVRKWDARTSALEQTFYGHRDAILDMCLSFDGKYAVTASDDGTCRVFDMAFGVRSF